MSLKTNSANPITTETTTISSSSIDELSSFLQECTLSSVAAKKYAEILVAIHTTGLSGIKEKSSKDELRSLLQKAGMNNDQVEQVIRRLQQDKDNVVVALDGQSGKSFKCENPDDVEIKGAQLLSHKLGTSDHALDGLYYGSFSVRLGLKKEVRQVIIKESIPGRSRAISHEVDIYQHLLNSRNSSCIEMYGYSLTAILPFIVLEDFGEDLRHYLQPDVDHDTKRQILKKCVEGITTITIILTALHHCSTSS